MKSKSILPLVTTSKDTIFFSTFTKMDVLKILCLHSHKKGLRCKILVRNYAEDVIVRSMKFQKKIISLHPSRYQVCYIPSFRKFYAEMDGQCCQLRKLCRNFVNKDFVWYGYGQNSENN